jgi:hypothetical protein
MLVELRGAAGGVTERKPVGDKKLNSVVDTGDAVTGVRDAVAKQIGLLCSRLRRMLR